MTAPRRGPGPGHDLQRFQALLAEVSGLELPEARRADLQRAVSRALAATGRDGPDALYRHLREPAGRQALDAFVSDLTIGETHFFRNRPQFEALERHILPELIERRRASRRLRVWSAACSTGEEPYSLAILLERLLPDRAAWDVRILATDINRAALERARRGRYSAWSCRDVPDDVADGFFVRNGPVLEVAGRIREAVSFSYLNLAGDHWPSAGTATLELDLVLCRNVLIYFGDDLTRQIADRLHHALSAGGWLLVAPAELSQTVFANFTVVNLNGAVVYRKPPAQVPGTPDPHPPGLGAPVFSGRVDPHPLGFGAPEREGNPAPGTTAPVVHSPPGGTARAGSGTGGTAPAGSPAGGTDEVERAVGEWRAGRAAEALGRLEAVAEADPADGRAPLLAARFHLDRLEVDRAAWWAEVACQRAPLSAPAHYLRGLALQEAGQLEDALAALRRSVFLDPRSVLGQLALADLLARRGEPGRARGALRAAAALVADRDPAEPVDDHEGLTTGRVRDLVAAQLSRLDTDPEVAR
jgi:chemotaxis protein methyltransferase CheR